MVVLLYLGCGLVIGTAGAEVDRRRRRQQHREPVRSRPACFDEHDLLDTPVLEWVRQAEEAEQQRWDREHWKDNRVLARGNDGTIEVTKDGVTTYVDGSDLIDPPVNPFHDVTMSSIGGQSFAQTAAALARVMSANQVMGRSGGVVEVFTSDGIQYLDVDEWEEGRVLWK